MSLIWKGDTVKADAIAAITDGLTEFGLTHETASKGRLRPGRGVLTGTLRRSVHAAKPGYNFAGDDVPPTRGAPERSGQGGGAAVSGNLVSIVVGSGMRYAAKIEDMYAYIQQGHDQVKGSLTGIIQKHAAKRGLM